MKFAALRHANVLAFVLLVSTVSVAAFGVALQIRQSPPDDAHVISNVCQLLATGIVGSVLVARRPDLSFGWILGVSAITMMLAIGVATPSELAFRDGHGSVLKLWGASLAGIQWVPAVLIGLLYARFPTGIPAGRFAHFADRALVYGTSVIALAGVLGSWPTHLKGVGTTARILDHTPASALAQRLTVGIPLLILLAAVLAIQVIVRFFRSAGLERLQLRWVAVSAAINLAAFPLVVAEKMPGWLENSLVFVIPTAILVPVLRHNLWAIDSIIRRGASHHLEAGGSPVEGIVRAAGEMLRLPYVAIVRGGTVVAQHGEVPGGKTEAWPLVHDGVEIGQLVAAPHFGMSAISDDDRRVLASVADLVTGSVLAATLTTELSDARSRLVSAREEERRRLRRDLHDGLGPTLTGLGLNIDAATANPARAAEYLAHAKEASTRMMADVRELVYGLRPPALDELGLKGAVELQLRRLTHHTGIDLDLDIPSLPELPAAVEVAVFRTAVEAVTNAVRHSAARNVRVSIQPHPILTLTVTDDGASTTNWSPGVGLDSIRERVDELGGAVTMGPTDHGGSVHATFPTGRM